MNTDTHSRLSVTFGLHQVSLPLPFWVGQEDNEQAREIFELYTGRLRIVPSDLPENSRRPVHFIGRLSRHFVLEFDSLVSIDEYVICEPSLMPIGKSLPQLAIGWARTVWDYHEGVPLSTKAIKQSEAAAAVASSAARDTLTDHLYCEPIWTTAPKPNFKYSHENAVRDPGYSGSYARFIANSPWPGSDIRSEHVRRFSPLRPPTVETKPTVVLEQVTLEQIESEKPAGLKRTTSSWFAPIIEDEENSSPVRTSSSGWFDSSDSDDDDEIIDDESDDYDEARDRLFGDSSDSDDDYFDDEFDEISVAELTGEDEIYEEDDLDVFPSLLHVHTTEVIA